MVQSRRLATGRSITALVLREISSSRGRLVGGYLWAILEPVAGIALLTLVFSLAFRAPPIGTSFALFYASGILPFLFYADMNIKIANALRFSKPLLFYPPITFVDAILARFLLNLLTGVVVFCIILSGLAVLIRGGIFLNVPAAILAVAMAGLLALGVGTVNCFLFVKFPVWERIWGILNKPMFIVSGIFFTFESVPREYRDILWFNPLVHVVGQMRRALFPTYDAAYVSEVYVLGVSFLLLAAGLVLLSRFHRELLEI